MFTISGVISILITSLLNAALGFAVFVRNPKSDLNRAFLGLALGTTLWTATSLVSDSTSNYELSRVASSLAFSFGFLGLFFVLLFTSILRKKKTKYSFWLYFIPAIAVSVLFATPLVYDLTTIEEFETGILYVPYILTLLVLLFASFYNLIVVFKSGNETEKNQSRYMLLGVAIMTLCGVTFNAVLPVFYPDMAGTFTQIGPLFSIFFIGLTGYAIIRHKLFDFRAVLARSLSYLLSTFFIALTYVSVGFLINQLLPRSRSDLGQLIQNVVITVGLVLVYPSIKNRFNKFTSKVFYRDAYDPQLFLGELNRALVTNAEVESLLTKSALVIQENLKASFTTFYIRETSYFPNRFIGAHKVESDIIDLDILTQASSKIHKKVHSTEREPENDNEVELNRVLKKNNIEVMARLVSTLDYEVAGIGQIFIGPKKSGSLYTTEDLKIIEIITNELVIAIQNVLRFEEIEQFNVTLQDKIDTATHELKRSNNKLKALDEAKDEFVSMASHQLRTPLTSIKGYISMVLEGDAGKVNDTQKQMLSQAMFSSQRMVYLISDLLNVSRLKTGKFIIEAKPVYLPDLVESEMSQLSEGAGSKNITIKFEKPKDFPTLNLDDMKLRQVIMNFTDNAIYYTPSGGKITVSLKNKKDSVEFTVKDTGIGVPKNEQHKLFAKFYRAENARKARPDGTGLGLFMAKKVIVAQGGAIIFDSKVGKGSTFGFSFPKNKLEVKST